MEEVCNHVDLQRNILWLGQTASGVRFKYRLNGLKQNEGGRRSEGITLAALAKPLPTVSENTASLEESDVNLAAMAAITGVDAATKIPEFKCHMRAQYQDLFKEPMGLPPARKDGGFRILTMLGIEPPHISPY
jgi:hypothetical protein